MKKTLLFRLVALMTTMMCAFSASALEAYANYKSYSHTLTFYCDANRSICAGETFDLNTGSNSPAWLYDDLLENVSKVIFDKSFVSARPTSTYEWFYRMSNLKYINGMEYLNTSQVTNMANMFCNCPQLSYMDLRNFDTSQVTDMEGMFAGCTVLPVLDLSSFNTSQVTNMSGMFDGCNLMRFIYVGNGWSTAAATESTNMFKDCLKLVGGMGTFYDANHDDAAYAHLDGGTSNPGYFADKNATMAYFFYTSSDHTLTFYCDNLHASRITGGRIYVMRMDGKPTWLEDCSPLYVVVFDSSFANARPTSTSFWFYDLYLKSITGLNYLNTSEVTSMSYMFYECFGPTSLDLSGFDTRNVTNMEAMFMFCSELTSLDVSNFNTSRVTTMEDMFACCTGLTSLDLSNFNTSQVTNMIEMFTGCSNLRTIYAGDGWSTDAVTNSDYMFSDCDNLVGGKGTAYDYYNPDDKTYARIDGGPSSPGYFTDNNASQRGDVDGDGQVGIGDVSSLIDYLLNGNASSINLDAADADGDSVVGIGDVSTLIDYLLSSHWPS